MIALYFGCTRGIQGRTQAGHGLNTPTYSRPSRAIDHAWGRKIDAQFAPRPAGKDSEAPQGQASLVHKGGWTIMAFWDRTGDSRGNSNSAFLFDKELDFAEALALSREYFPDVHNRLAAAGIQVTSY